MYSMRQVCCLVTTTTTLPRKRHSESNVSADRLVQGKNSEINFVVMENVFHPEVPIDEQYDLKVSLSSLCTPQGHSGVLGQSKELHCTDGTTLRPGLDD